MSDRRSTVGPRTPSRFDRAIAGLTDPGARVRRAQPALAGLILLSGAVTPQESPGLRLDLAYALNPIAGVSRWQFSIGSTIGL